MRDVRCAMATPGDELERMKAQVATRNPFDIHAWVPRMRVFMDNLRTPR